MNGPLVRPVEDDDLESIVAIYNDVLESSSTIWRDELTSVGERRAGLAEAAAHDHPVLVAADASGVLGFIAAESFRPWSGYAATFEHSIHVRNDSRSQGVGGLLLAAMEAALRIRRAHVMVAGIDSENEGSLRFHGRAGFVQVGRMPEVGMVKGSWRDLTLVQKILLP